MFLACDGRLREVLFDCVQTRFNEARRYHGQFDDEQARIFEIIEFAFDASLGREQFEKGVENKYECHTGQRTSPEIERGTKEQRVKENNQIKTRRRSVQ